MGNTSSSNKDGFVRVRRGQGRTFGEGELFKAGAGSTVLAKSGSIGVFLNGSNGTAYSGSVYTAEAGSVVNALYGSVGKARAGSTVLARYGAIIDQERGATVISLPDEAEHREAGAVVIRHCDMDPVDKTLVEQAWESAKNTYSPYSNFPVGSAVLAENAKGDLRVFTGINIENASYGGTVCAERVAIWDAVKCGYRKIKKIAVVCAKHPGGSPCGLCRQVMREFGKDAEVFNVFNTDSDVVLWTVDDGTSASLLLDSFGPDSL